MCQLYITDFSLFLVLTTLKMPTRKLGTVSRAFNPSILKFKPGIPVNSRASWTKPAWIYRAWPVSNNNNKTPNSNNKQNNHKKIKQRACQVGILSFRGGEPSVLVCFSGVVIKHWIKAMWGRKWNICFTARRLSSREAKKGTESETMEEHCFCTGWLRELYCIAPASLPKESTLHKWAGPNSN